MPINQPSNQIKFTNVSVVRLKKGKKRFELACYKNKLLEYRSGAEKDLDNVLQVPTIFLSVSKAQTAPSAEVAKAFGANVTSDEARQEILRKGEVQVGERERKEMSERVEKEMLDIVSGRLVDPTTKRVYTPGMIAKALDQLSSASGHLQQQQQHLRAESTDRVNIEERQSPPRKQSPQRKQSPHRQPSPQGKAPPQNKPLWTGVAPNKSAKSQALEAMKALIAWQPIPVMKARMRLRVTCPVNLLKQPVKAAPAAGGATKEKIPELPEPPSSKQNNKKGGKNKRSARKGDPDDTEAVSDAEPQPQKSNNKKGNKSNKRSARKGNSNIQSDSDAETQPPKTKTEPPKETKKGGKNKRAARKADPEIKSDSDSEPHPPKPTYKKPGKSKRSLQKGEPDINSGTDSEHQSPKPNHKKGGEAQKGEPANKSGSDSEPPTYQKGGNNKQSARRGDPDSDELQAPRSSSPRRRSPSPARPTTPTKTTNPPEPTEPPSPTKAPNTVKAKILSHIESIDKEEIKYDEWEVIGYAEPGAYKTLNELVSLSTKGRGRVEVLDMTVTKEE